MSRHPETLRTNITWIDAIAVLAAAVAGLVWGTGATAVLCGATMAGAIGVWRAIRFLGKMLEYVQDSTQDRYEADYRQGWKGTPDR